MLRQNRIASLGKVLLNEKVKAGHGVTKLFGAICPGEFGRGVFSLPVGNGVGEKAPLSGLIRGLRIVRGDTLADIVLAFPVGKSHESGDGAAGSEGEQRTGYFCHGGNLHDWLKGFE